MELREYQMMAAAEDVHPWFISTRGIISDCFHEVGITPDNRVLDVGCATGGTMKTLSGMARFTGLDSSPVAAGLARELSGAEVVMADATAMPFDDASFDGVVACHILEHILDHDAAVAEIRRVLKPGGPLIALVPCHQFMFNGHDLALHHVRRYSRRGFIDLLTRNGFSPMRVAWTNPIVFPATAMLRMVSRLSASGSSVRAGSDTTHGLGPFLPFMNLVTGVERSLTRSVPLPFGVGLLILAH
ncbi:MAG TPA: methyltransferase domain-containing protein [Myxococcota bacterium]|nr:methyltransferase domain-containing protein [Myxococcota bacterium]HPB50282.1 methyltransferase domain-containing protein [Myxococcota bacterium]